MRRAKSLSTYYFSTLYTTLRHNLIKEKLLDLIEWTFKRALKLSFALFKPVDLHLGHVRMYKTLYPISWTISIFDLEPSYTDKLLYKLRLSRS